MCDAQQTVVFLHGTGSGPESWDAQRRSLPAGFDGLAPQLPGLRNEDDREFSLSLAARLVRDALDARGTERVHLCGLSLGAMVATRFVIDYPHRVASLVLSGGQVRPNPVLMRVQNAIIRALPERIVAPEGVSKQAMLAVLRDVAATDFRGELSQIVVPTLVLCGQRDRANLRAARGLAASIPAAQLQVVSGAGHEWNTQLPEQFSARLTTFYTAWSQGNL